MANVPDAIDLTDKTTIHVFEGNKIVGIYDKTTGFPRLDNELAKYEDKELARNRNRAIELEVTELREILDYNGHQLEPERVEGIEEEIEDLLEERDKNTYKYGLAGKEFERLYLEKQHRPEVNGDSRFRFITEEMVTLYSQKNTDYGDAFTESLDEDGLLVSKIRLKDKLNRFSQLINNDALVNDESMRDTLIDLANYAVMTMMWIDDNE